MVCSNHPECLSRILNARRLEPLLYHTVIIDGYYKALRFIASMQARQNPDFYARNLKVFAFCGAETTSMWLLEEHQSLRTAIPLLIPALRGLVTFVFSDTLPELLGAVLTHCPSLRRLRMFGAKFELAVLQNTLPSPQQPPHLTHLCVRPTRSLPALLECLPGITHLALEWDDEACVEGVEELLSAPPSTLRCILILVPALQLIRCPLRLAETLMRFSDPRIVRVAGDLWNVLSKYELDVGKESEAMFLALNANPPTCREYGVPRYPDTAKDDMWEVADAVVASRLTRAQKVSST